MFKMRKTLLISFPFQKKILSKNIGTYDWKSIFNVESSLMFLKYLYIYYYYNRQKYACNEKSFFLYKINVRKSRENQFPNFCHFFCSERKKKGKLRLMRRKKVHLKIAFSTLSSWKKSWLAVPSVSVIWTCLTWQGHTVMASSQFWYLPSSQRNWRKYCFL